MKWSEGESPDQAGGESWELASVARFFGRFEHSIDGKGRLILPAKFRAPFEHGGYLTQHHDGCLALWTPEQFDSQLLRMQERASSNRSQRNQARYWASTSHESEIDRQGRMMIPTLLRTYA